MIGHSFWLQAKILCITSREKKGRLGIRLVEGKETVEKHQRKGKGKPSEIERLKNSSKKPKRKVRKQNEYASLHKNKRGSKLKKKKKKAP
jgi:hypothetical protein